MSCAKLAADVAANRISGSALQAVMVMANLCFQGRPGGGLPLLEDHRHRCHLNLRDFGLAGLHENLFSRYCSSDVSNLQNLLWSAKAV